MAEGIKVTKTKYDELVARLKYLETTAREDVAAAIKAAKEFGDLSENAEYSAAKDEQVKIETEIAKLSDTLINIQIIDESAITTDAAALGTKVKVKRLRDGKISEYKLVSSMEVNSKENKISDQSPIGKAVAGHRVGETVVANTPGGDLQLEILDISK